MSEIDERIGAYLDGSLSSEAARRLEHELLDPEVALAFRQNLLLRHLLADLSPGQPPPGLVARIQGSLGVEVAAAVERPSWGDLLPSLPGPAWSLLLPALPSSPEPGPTREAFAGWSYASQALHPLVLRRERELAPPSPPLWQRVLPSLGAALRPSPKPLWRRLLFGGK